jgi:hypothetical protein
VDVSIEYDRGFGPPELFGSPSSGVSLSEAQINLSRSQVAADKPKLQLDWASVRKLFSQMRLDDIEALGIHVRVKRFSIQFNC